MLKIVYDRVGKYGFIPNLTSNIEIKPKSKEWWDLCIQSPYSYEFRFLRYLDVEDIPYTEVAVNDYDDSDGYYPIHLNIFDSTISYFDLISESALSLVRENRLKILFHYSEGDNPTLDIIPTIERECRRKNININNVIFLLANANCEQYKNFIFFPDDEIYYRYLHFRIPPNTEVNLNIRSKKFTLLNRISKPFRKLLAALVWKNHLYYDAYFSYNNISYCTPHTEEANPVLQWNRYWENPGQLIEEFDQQLPITSDELSDSDHNNHKLIVDKYYSDAYWHVVVETHFDASTVFLTEKTFKPILNLQPFIIVGAPNSLTTLKNLGYQTFESVIDESYDQIVDNEQRLHACFEIIKYFNSLTHAEHQAIINQLKDILLYNQQHFLSSKKDQLLKIINKLKS